MALTPVTTVSRSQLSLESGNVMYMALKRRVAVLQAFADEQGEKWVDGIPLSIQSYEDAAAAARAYDGPWFRSLPYSRRVRRKIAIALLEACRPYNFVNTDVWITYAR